MILSDTTDGIEGIRERLGPQRVKTPQIEVEQFDLEALSRLAEKSNTFKPYFGNFMMTKVTPKNGCTCEEEDDTYG